ncbi:hypothetical protein [Bifidobacterium criceti]|uniref:hypothetical protein n=1 Tax=Bifidobacterium criceti TaxID=1960969 RepID=UPI0012FFCE2D|nr:hypothetical protein [Bifidobacterium criceti]
MEGKLVGVAGDTPFTALDDVIDFSARYLKVALQKIRSVDSMNEEKRRMGRDDDLQ